jgi:hypothetical protein
MEILGDIVESPVDPDDWEANRIEPGWRTPP